MVHHPLYETSIQGLPVAAKLLSRIITQTRSGELTWMIWDDESHPWGFAYITHKSALALRMRVTPDGGVHVITDTDRLTFNSRLLARLLDQELGGPGCEAMDILEGRHDEDIAALVQHLRARFTVPDKWDRSRVLYPGADEGLNGAFPWGRDEAFPGEFDDLLSGVGVYDGVVSAYIWINQDIDTPPLPVKVEIEPIATLRIRNLHVMAGRPDNPWGVGVVPDWMQEDVVVFGLEIGDLYEDIAGENACLQHWENQYPQDGASSNDEHIEQITEWLSKVDFASE